jgi:hypothetical protein
MRESRVRPLRIETLAVGALLVLAVGCGSGGGGRPDGQAPEGDAADAPRETTGGDGSTADGPATDVPATDGLTMDLAAIADLTGEALLDSSNDVTGSGDLAPSLDAPSSEGGADARDSGGADVTGQPDAGTGADAHDAGAPADADAGICDPPDALCEGGVCCGAACVDTSTSVDNCGGCGLACSASHVARGCGAGVCNGPCDVGFADCNANKLTDGCETSTSSDKLNCGGCGNVCSTNNVIAQCTGGACNGACSAGFADCNANKLTDGCETDTNNDPLNCGSCGNSCGGGTCSGGSCI